VIRGQYWAVGDSNSRLPSSADTSRTRKPSRDTTHLLTRRQTSRCATPTAQWWTYKANVD
jgi:hypothetical protein